MNTADDDGHLLKKLAKEVGSVRSLNTFDLSHFEKIYSALHALADSQPNIKELNPTYKCADHLQSFLKWIKSNNVDVGNVDIRTCEYGFGVFAKEQIDKDSILASIPLKLMIVSDPSQISELDLLVKSDPILRSIPNLVLILRLLIEFNKHDSLFKNYINILPRYFDLPMFYTPSKLAFLKGTSLFGLVIKDQVYLAQQYLHIMNLLKARNYSLLTANQFTLQAFMWARAITLTRQNPIPIVDDINLDTDAENKTQLCLIPFYDMFNHKHGEVKFF